MRATVLRGLAGLVANPLAHPLLARLLPQLAPLAFDRQLAVRTAMADLLLAIKCAPPHTHARRKGRTSLFFFCTENLAALRPRNLRKGSLGFPREVPGSTYTLYPAMGPIQFIPFNLYLALSPDSTYTLHPAWGPGSTPLPLARSGAACRSAEAAA